LTLSRREAGEGPGAYSSRCGRLLTARSEPANPRPRRNTPHRPIDKRDINGWCVYVSPQLVDQPGLCANMLTLLSYKLHMIDHFIAEPGRKQLHEVPIWLEIGQLGPYIRYCSGSGQLTARE